MWMCVAEWRWWWMMLMGGQLRWQGLRACDDAQTIQLQNHENDHVTKSNGKQRAMLGMNRQRVKSSSDTYRSWWQTLRRQLRWQGPGHVTMRRPFSCESPKNKHAKMTSPKFVMTPYEAIAGVRQVYDLIHLMTWENQGDCMKAEQMVYWQVRPWLGGYKGEWMWWTDRAHMAAEQKLWCRLGNTFLRLWGDTIWLSRWTSLAQIHIRFWLFWGVYAA